MELFEGKPIFRLIVKGGKQHVKPIAEPVADRLQAYAFRHGLAKSDKLFKMSWQPRSLSMVNVSYTSSVMLEALLLHRKRHLSWRYNADDPASQR